MKFINKNIVITRGAKGAITINKQEVVIVPRKLEKKGFFERFYSLFLK